MHVLKNVKNVLAEHSMTSIYNCLQAHTKNSNILVAVAGNG